MDQTVESISKDISDRQTDRNQDSHPPEQVVHEEGDQGKANVVLLSPFFFPEIISTGKYNTALVEGLQAGGIRTAVITSEPLYPDWVPRKTDCVLPGIEIIRGGGRLRYPKSPVLRRIVLELWYASWVARKLPRQKHPPDACIAVFPPNLFWPMARLFSRNAVPCIGIVHDLQSVFVQQSASPLRRILGGIVRKMEGVALRSCDRLIFLSQSMATRAATQHRLDPHKCVVHFPFVTLPSVKGGGQALGNRLPAGLRHIVYSGALGEKQNPEQLVQCLIELTRMGQDLAGHCFSRGPAFERLKAAYQDRPRLFFHDLVDERDLPELLDRSDIQIVPQLFGTSEAAIPSKLPNLIASGVPILAICDQESELGKIIVEAQAGAVALSWAPDLVASATINLLNETSLESRDIRRTKAARYVEENFSLSRLVNDVASFVKTAGIPSS